MTLDAATRARLRPGVDAGALAAFLTLVPPDQHAEFIVACLADPTPAELRAAGRYAYWAHGGANGAPGGAPLAHRPPAVDYDFGDPELARRWRAVGA